MKIIAITTPKVIDEDVLIITALLNRGIDIVHLRKPDSNVEECRELLAKLTVDQRENIIIHDFKSQGFFFDFTGFFGTFYSCPSPKNTRPEKADFF